jgi:hypothetical protein
MILYTLEDLDLREIKVLRQSLDFIPLTGKDAAFIAILQGKIQQQIQQIEEHLMFEAEEEKQKSLEEALKRDIQSVSSSPSKKK